MGSKQIAKNSTGGFGANTEKNPKEECKAIMIRSKRETMVEDEGRISNEQELVVEEEKEKKKEDQMREKKINDGEEEEKEEKNEKKREKRRKKRRQRVSWPEKKRRRLSHAQGRKHHILWSRPRNKRNDTLLVSLISSRNWR